MRILSKVSAYKIDFDEMHVSYDKKNRKKN